MAISLRCMGWSLPFYMDGPGENVQLIRRTGAVRGYGDIRRCADRRDRDHIGIGDIFGRLPRAVEEAAEIRSGALVSPEAIC